MNNPGDDKDGVKEAQAYALLTLELKATIMSTSKYGQTPRMAGLPG